MVKPTSKPARTELPDVAALAPAPDNGVHYAEPAPAATPAPARAGRGVKVPTRTLGARVPEDLYERLARCSEETGVPQAFLVARGLERELEARGY